VADTNTHAAPAPGHGHGDGHGHGHVHVVPLPILLGTFFALIFLTAVTFWATFFDFGPFFNVTIALAIATVKAAFVCLYFMHLRYDRPVNILFFFSSLLFLAVFLWFALLDVGAYQQQKDSSFSETSVTK
jgi:cytochrome c oxidase subunit 4